MTDTLAEVPAGTGRDFPATHWTVVLTAANGCLPQAEATLEQLCTAYWYPVYAFVRRRGHSPEEAKDLTQEFFARLLKKQLLCGLKREGGKFRSFLLTTVKCFLANEWHRVHAVKRGGGKLFVAGDAELDRRYQQELVEQTTPETLFERQWALTLLDRVLARLRDEYHAAGKINAFEHLQPFLPSADCGMDYGKASAALQMNEPAVRMAVHRLRRRYGELLRAEIGSTVSNPAQIDEEIQHLIAAISQK